VTQDTARSLVVVGTGGHASVIVDLALALGIQVEGCIGPRPEKSSVACPYLGEDEIVTHYSSARYMFTVGVGTVGDTALRRRLFKWLAAGNHDLPVLIHPAATVAKSAEIRTGTQVLAKAVVQPHVDIGCNAIINSASVVEHHSVVGDHCHIAPGAVVCGNVQIGRDTHIGANATILQNLVIGSGVIVGAGAIVLRDLPDGTRAHGVIN
jgi:sugar O-acyltransferase (sialic acid O-acetyltransferase NeuD family)